MRRLGGLDETGREGGRHRRRVLTGGWRVGSEWEQGESGWRMGGNGLG